MRLSLVLVVPLLLVVVLGAALPAAAHDWLNEWRPPYAEYRAEFERARMLEKLDCAGLTAYVAEQNWRMNQWIYAEYHRPCRSLRLSLPPPDRERPRTSPRRPDGKVNSPSGTGQK